MPTQTYTPSVTWHNTSRYQENGDVTDATIGSAESGEDALDNIAYLTGGNTLTQVAQLWTVANLAALKAVAAANRRDQDYCVLDDNKRLYQFDSASAATGDDYSVVVPSAGTGRWILVGSAVPKSTTFRRVISAVAMYNETAGGNFVFPDMANGRLDHTGSLITAWAQFQGLKAGDIIDNIEVCGNANVAGGGGPIDADFYLYQADDGDTSPTITVLGTCTIAAGSGDAAPQVVAAPLPVTIPEGGDRDIIVVETTMTLGAGDQDYLYWVAINGTRSYITE